jgi:hypothetical protein
MTAIVDGIKRCPRCARELPLVAFYRNHRLRQGRSCYCRECTRAYARAYGIEHYAPRSRTTREPFRRDLTDQHFGDLVALRPLSFPNTDLLGRAGWVCRCRCGKEVLIQARGLLYQGGHNCRHKKRTWLKCREAASTTRKRRTDQKFIGARFGRLRVIARAPGSLKFIMQCDCGSTKPLAISEVVTGGVVSCGCVRAAQRKDPVVVAGRRKNRERRRSTRESALLTDQYIARTFYKSGLTNRSMIPSELIEAKRLHIKLLRCIAEQRSAPKDRQ